MGEKKVYTVQPLKEYLSTQEIAGPLMLVEMVDEAKYGHIVDIELPDGSVRHGQILQVDGAIGAEFMVAFKRMIEDPLTMLL